MCFDSSTGLYSCQLDEKWFNLHKDILKDALDITPTNDNNPYVAPPLSDTVIEYVNTLRYPGTLKNVSTMFINALYQPWRAILSIINMCLTGKTAGYDRPRHLVLQILWGIIHRSNIDYAERIWEEFVQSIQTFLTDRKNLATASREKKKTTRLLIPNVRFTKLIIHHLKTKNNIQPRTGLPLHYSHDENVLNTLRFVGKDGREIFGMPIPDALLTDEIKGAPYYGEYQEHVAKYQQYLDAEHGKAEEGRATESLKATKAPTQPSKAVLEKKRKLVKETPDEPSPTKRSKGGLVGKIRKPRSPLKLVDEPSAEDVPVEEPAYNEEEANLQRDLELSLKEQAERNQGPARPVVIREPDSRRIQPFLDVQGKGKEKVVDEQAAHDLLTLMTPKKRALQARPNPGDHDKGQTGPNPDVQDEGQAGSNPGDAAESQPQSSHVVHAGPNREIMDLKATDALTRQNPEQMDEEFTITAYPNEEEPGKTNAEAEEEESRKTNAEAEVQSMVLVLVHQDTSSVPLMTTQVIDLTMPQSGSLLPTSTTTSIITTTSLLPPPQQSTIDPTLVKHIDKLKQHMANLLQYNLAMEERLDKHGSRLYKLENLNIPHQVSKAVNEIVTDVVDWALQAPLRARFSDLPTIWKMLTRRKERDVTYQELFLGLHRYSHHIHLLQQAHLVLRVLKEHQDLLTSAPQSMAWTTSDTRYESAGVYGTKELCFTDSLIQDDSIPDEQERPATLEPAWTIPSSTVSDVENNWATTLVSAYETPAENSLLAKTRDMMNFLNWYYLEYLRYGNKGSSPALSISKMKAVSYPNFGLKLLVPEQISSILTDMLHCRVEKKSDQTYRFLVSSELKPTRDMGYEFKHDYTIIESPRVVVFSVNNNKRKIMRFNEIYKFSDGTLTRILEELAYRVKEFKIRQLNPGMNMRFWAQKDVTRSKEFIVAIERRLKTKRIYRNLECFIGGRGRDIDYRLLQRME
uniref:Monodehydroascorbate reductase n=1 Tax=Tanacetum cinerariifolium TaxID=118510 RepID=A0A699GTQ3_TANCI|nr:hypothetical protein [Tanacetum cinerariifolium]